MTKKRLLIVSTIILLVISGCQRKNNVEEGNIDIPEVEKKEPNQIVEETFDGLFNYVRRNSPKEGLSFYQPVDFTREKISPETISFSQEGYRVFVSFAKAEDFSARALQHTFRPIITKDMFVGEKVKYEITSFEYGDTTPYVDKDMKVFTDQAQQKYTEFFSSDDLKKPVEVNRTLGYKETANIEFFNLSQKNSLKKNDVVIYYGFLNNIAYAVYGTSETEFDKVDELVTVMTESVMDQKFDFLESVGLAHKPSKYFDFNFYLPNTASKIYEGYYVLRDDNSSDGIEVMINDMSFDPNKFDFINETNTFSYVKKFLFDQNQKSQTNGLTKTVISAQNSYEPIINKNAIVYTYDYSLDYAEGKGADKFIMKDVPAPFKVAVIHKNGSNRAVILTIIGEMHQKDTVEKLFEMMIKEIE